MKKTHYVLLATFLSAMAGLAAQQPDWREKQDEIKKLRAGLAQEGLYAFCSNRTAGVAAPLIHSQCFVDWITNVEERAYEQEKRDFGLDFVKQIEPVALDFLLPADTSVWERKAEDMLTVSRWVGGEAGYGNFILKRWTEDIACIAIGHLVADIECPMNKIHSLLSQVGTVQDNLQIQFAILDEEAPHHFKKFTAKASSDVYKEMYLQWGQHVIDARKYYKDKGRYFPFTFADTKEDPHEVAFYCDDTGRSGMFTLKTTWGRKRHFAVCGTGFSDPIADRVRELLLFREKVGHFPLKETKPLGLADFYQSEIRAAFYEAWTPFEKEYGKIGGGRTFEQIRDNRFMDERTRELFDEREANRKRIESPE